MVFVIEMLVSTTNNLASTKDGGLTWDTIYSLPNNCNKLEWVNDGPSKQGFYIAYGNTGSYISYNNGEKWQRIDAKTHGNISFFNAEVGVSSYPKESNGNGNRLWDAFTSSISNEKKTEFSIYPNPFSSEINIKSGADFTDFEIFDIRGQIIKTGNVFPQLENKISLDGLSLGIYFIVLKSDYYYKKFKLIKN